MDAIREAAIRYVGANYDKEQLEMLLSEETTPNPVHEEPLIQAFIAGANSQNKTIGRLQDEIAHLIGICQRCEKRDFWVRVEDRLPNKRKNDEGKELTESKDVFVRTEFVDDDGRVYVGYGIARCFFPSEGGHEWSTPGVTHWRYITEPKLG